MALQNTRRSFLASGLALPAASVAAPKPQVRYRMLGRTGLKVSEVGCGCEGISDISVIERALDLGINFFDTARPYDRGNNERLVGKALGGRRKDIILCSRSYHGRDRKSLMADLEASLTELGTDYLDVWYLGDKNEPAQVTEEMLETQAAAQKQGKVRFKGISTHRFEKMLPLVAGKGAFDVVLMPYSFAMGTPRDPFRFPNATPEIGKALDEFNRAGLGVVAMKVMAGGYRMHRQGGALKGVFEKDGAHLAALKWALRTAKVHTTIAGMADRDILEENVRAMTEPFTDADARRLTARLDQAARFSTRW